MKAILICGLFGVFWLFGDFFLTSRVLARYTGVRLSLLNSASSINGVEPQWNFSLWLSWNPSVVSVRAIGERGEMNS